MASARLFSALGSLGHQDLFGGCPCQPAFLITCLSVHPLPLPICLPCQVASPHSWAAHCIAACLPASHLTDCLVCSPGSGQQWHLSPPSNPSHLPLTTMAAGSGGGGQVEGTPVTLASFLACTPSPLCTTTHPPHTCLHALPSRTCLAVVSGQRERGVEEHLGHPSKAYALGST